MSELTSFIKALTAIDMIIVLSIVVVPTFLIVAAIATAVSALFGRRDSDEPKFRQTNAWNRDMETEYVRTDEVGQPTVRRRSQSPSIKTPRVQGMSS